MDIPVRPEKTIYLLVNLDPPIKSDVFFPPVASQPTPPNVPPPEIRVL